MNQKDSNNLLDKEKEYNAIFDDFLKSASDRTFTKIEVEKLLEANMYKEVIGKYQQGDNKPMTKNIIVSSKGITARFFNKKFLLNFLFSYLFYIGFLVIISYIFYRNSVDSKLSVFIIALVFTVIDKFVKPLIFIADLISFTFHKVGLLTLGIYSLTFFILGNALGLAKSISFSQSILVAIIILLLTFVIDFIKHDTMINTSYFNDSDDEEEETSDEDE